MGHGGGEGRRDSLTAALHRYHPLRLIRPAGLGKGQIGREAGAGLHLQIQQEVPIGFAATIDENGVTLQTQTADASDAAGHVMHVKKVGLFMHRLHLGQDGPHLRLARLVGGEGVLAI